MRGGRGVIKLIPLTHIRLIGGGERLGRIVENCGLCFIDRDRDYKTAFMLSVRFGRSGAAVNWPSRSMDDGSDGPRNRVAPPTAYLMRRGVWGLGYGWPARPRLPQK